MREESGLWAENRDKLESLFLLIKCTTKTQLPISSAVLEPERTKNALKLHLDGDSLNWLSLSFVLSAT